MNHSRIKMFMLCLLMTLAFLGNVGNIELFLGIHFIFGSIFIFLILHYYNTKLGVLAALLSGIYTVYLWDNLFGLTILLLEAGIVGYLYNRHKRRLILWDVLFIIFIGMPISILFSYYLLGFDWLNTLLVMLKQSVNMLLNILIANMLIIVIDSFKVVKGSRRVSLHELLFNLLLLFFLVPLVTSLFYIGKGEISKVQDSMRNQIKTTYNELNVQFRNFYLNNEKQLNTIATLHPFTSDESTKSLNSEDLLLLQQSNESIKILYATDSNGDLYKIHWDDPLLRQHNLNYDQNDLQSFKEHWIDQAPQPVTYVSDMFRAGPNNRYLFTISVPSIEFGELKGYIVAAYNPLTAFKTIVEGTNVNNMKITMIDRNNRVLATNDEENQQYYEELVLKGNELYANDPLSVQKEEHVSSLQEWTDMYYSTLTTISPDIPWKVHISIPISDFENPLYKASINLLLTVFLFAVIALLISYLVAKWIQSTLVKVNTLTNNLPEKIANNEEIAWPRVIIKEVSSIIDNFKLTELKLRKMFDEIVDSQNELHYLAHFDQLTTLYNRNYMMERFNDLLLQDTQSRMAILFIDLDRFKIVNDTLGHHAGDQVLTEVARRLKEVCDSSSIISRQGGDEFIILLPSIENEWEIEFQANAMIKVLSKPYNLYGNEYHLTASIGISLYPNHGNDIDTLIKYADLAMYSVKDNGKANYMFYTSTLQSNVVSKVTLENELRHAIERNELELYYQPQVNLQNQRITGVEALVRWKHPLHGFVSPAEFIPVAEETGQIIEIGNWILKKACKDARSWQKMGYKPISMSVNISMRQFLHDNLLLSVQEALKESKLNPKYLKLEITESVAMSKPDQVLQKLEQLKKLNIELALDDFGTGYSSLNYLKSLPVDILKIDRSFIKDIDQNDEDITIVKALIEMAHSFGMTVVAEGVEKECQKDMLTDIHCDLLQGYVFSKPLQARELLKFIIENEIVTT